MSSLQNVVIDIKLLYLRKISITQISTAKPPPRYNIHHRQAYRLLIYGEEGSDVLDEEL